MKQIKLTFLLTALLSMVGARMLAFDTKVDKTIQFVDKNGNVVADGATVNVEEGEKDVFGDLLFKTGLFVSNTSENDVYIGIDYEIKSLPNGAFQICFPQNCVQKPLWVSIPRRKVLWLLTRKRTFKPNGFPTRMVSALVLWNCR